MKIKTLFILVAGLIVLLNSCLGSSSYGDDDENNLSNCQITSVTAASDSLSILSDVKFTIDQLNKQIFYLDSLPYGTEVKQKAYVTFNFSYVVKNAIAIEASGDTVNLGELVSTASDSIDIFNPVQIHVYALDGIESTGSATMRTYTMSLGIHQVNPEAMSWIAFKANVLGQSIKDEKVIAWEHDGNPAYFMYTQPAGGKGYQLYTSGSDMDQWTEQTGLNLPEEGVNLQQICLFNDTLYAIVDGVIYTSADGITWNKSTAEDAPVVKAIYGTIPAGDKNEAMLALLTEDSEGELYYAKINAADEWTIGDKHLASCPVEGFGSTGFDQMYYGRLMIAAGRDEAGQLTADTWTTMNGLKWVKSSYTPFEGVREGAMLSRYDGKFFLIGGIGKDNTALSDIYVSIDEGVHWTLADEETLVMPEDYAGRGYSSVIIDNDNYMLFFGGKTTTNTNILDEIWRGRINRLGF